MQLHGVASKSPLSSDSFALAQEDNGCSQAPSFRRGVGPSFNKFCAAEDFPNDLSLHAYTFSVNDPRNSEARFMRLPQVLLNNTADITRRNCVQIYDVCQWQLNWFRKRIVGIDALVRVVRRGGLRSRLQLGA